MNHSLLRHLSLDLFLVWARPVEDRGDGYAVLLGQGWQFFGDQAFGLERIL